MIGGVNLWDPTHVSFTADLVTAFLLGIVHGITPDEHTWPITFSYAIGGYSTARGLRAGLLFSAARNTDEKSVAWPCRPSARCNSSSVQAWRSPCAIRATIAAETRAFRAILQL